MFCSQSKPIIIVHYRAPFAPHSVSAFSHMHLELEQEENEFCVDKSKLVKGIFIL